MLALELNPDYVKALLRRAELYEQTEQLEKALDDYQKVLERDPKQTAAGQACAVSSGPVAVARSIPPVFYLRVSWSQIQCKGRRDATRKSRPDEPLFVSCSSVSE